ncbi:unnamed protein product [Meganyctiphanes norvegica]|uniref:Uncharacterized protein n=1 Tax=Meganyctiphanes norvegica TaxID=48144 RepID=A0AAV2PJL2_MEGNR
MVATAAAANMPSSKEVSEDVESADPEAPVRPQRTSQVSRSPSPKYYQNDTTADETTLPPYDTSVTSLPPYPLDDSGYQSPTKPPSGYQSPTKLSHVQVQQPKSYQNPKTTHSNFTDGVDDGLRMPPPPPKKVTHSFNEEFLTVAALCLASAFAFFCCPIMVERPQQ